MGLKERAAERRKRMVGHVARNFKDAEDWDLDFWQSLTPEDRLSALVAIHCDIAKVEEGRSRSARQSKRKSYMDTVQDSEDVLDSLAKHEVRYLIIGGLAFIYHGKPRYTKDMGLWIDPSPENIRRANAALAEFGSPFSLDAKALTEITQVGMPPNRIDFLLSIEGEEFEAAWKKRIKGNYGRAPANWIDIDTLIRIKSRIDNPRHQEDVRVLREVKKRRAKTR